MTFVKERKGVGVDMVVDTMVGDGDDVCVRKCGDDVDVTVGDWRVDNG